MNEFPVVTQSEILYAIERAHEDPELLHQTEFLEVSSSAEPFTFRHRASSAADKMHDLHTQFVNADNATYSIEHTYHFERLLDGMTGYSDGSITTGVFYTLGCVVVLCSVNWYLMTRGYRIKD